MNDTTMALHRVVFMHVMRNFYVGSSRLLLSVMCIVETK